MFSWSWHYKLTFCCSQHEMMDVKTQMMHYAFGITDLRCLLVTLRKCKNVKSCEFILLSLALVFHDSAPNHKRFSGYTWPILS